MDTMVVALHICEERCEEMHSQRAFVDKARWKDWWLSQLASQFASPWFLRPTGAQCLPVAKREHAATKSIESASLTRMVDTWSAVIPEAPAAPLASLF